MKTFLISLLFLCLLTLKTQAQTKNFIDQPYIETIAQVDTVVIADRIYLEFVISEKNLKGNFSLEQEETKMISVLKEIGIDVEKNLKLKDLESYFKGGMLRRKDMLQGKVYTLVVNNAVMVGKVVEALVKTSVTNINIREVEYSGMDKIKMELKTKAVLKAKEQATALTAPLNQKTGPAIFISDYSYGISMKNFDSYNGGSEAYEIDHIRFTYNSKRFEIQFEEIEVKSIVAVKFRLE